MTRITIELDEELFKEIKKRAKKQFFDIKDMVEDIVRRSMVSYKGGTKQVTLNIDDKLVMAFSRDKRGRKGKKKGKKKK